MNKIFVGGIQGVGKSTIVSNISDNNKGIGKFSFGDLLRNKSQETFNDYRGVDKLSFEEREYIITLIKKDLDILLLGNEYHTLLFDNHFTIYRGGKIINTFIDTNIQFYNQLILITLPVEQLIDRVLKDEKERTNIINSTDLIIEHAELERKRAYFLSQKYSLPLIEIDNISVKESVENILNFIE